MLGGYCVCILLSVVRKSFISLTKLLWATPCSDSDTDRETTIQITPLAIDRERISISETECWLILYQLYTRYSHLGRETLSWRKCQSALC